MAVTAVGLVSAAGGLVIAIDQVPAASSGDRSALYAASAAVLVSMVGGAVALITNRRNRPDPDPHAATREIVDLLVDVKNERDEAVRQAEACKAKVARLNQRIKDLGGTP